MSWISGMVIKMIRKRKIHSNNNRETGEIEAGEPLGYIEFGTDRKIVLKRFEATDKLHTIGGEIIHARAKKWKTLGARYELFDRSPMRKIIMKEILENLL